MTSLSQGIRLYCQLLPWEQPPACSAYLESSHFPFYVDFRPPTSLFQDQTKKTSSIFGCWAPRFHGSRYWSGESKPQRLTWKFGKKENINNGNSFLFVCFGAWRCSGLTPGRFWGTLWDVGPRTWSATCKEGTHPNPCAVTPALMKKSLDRPSAWHEP